MLLAEHAVLRHLGRQQRAPGALGFAIGDGDGAGVGLVVDRQSAAEIATNDRPCGVGELMGQGDQFGGNGPGHDAAYCGSGTGESDIVRR